MRVLVVGAGPTGLTAAVELARRGIEVLVVEKRKKGSGLSRAVGILPASLELLKPSGVSDRLTKEGMKFRKVQLFNRDRLLLELPIDSGLDREEFILGLAQDRTEYHLRKSLKKFGGLLHYNKEFVGLSQDETKVTARLKDGKQTEFDYVIGADGTDSITRQLIGIDFPGFDLPETWSIADVEAKGWAHNDALVACKMTGRDIVVAVPLEPERYRVISNTPNSLELLPLPLDVTKIRKQGQFNISIRQAVTYQKGRVFIAGDAAHCHSPVGGRGMNIGIADAADLARRIAEGDLDDYTQHRHRDGQQLVAGTERARKLITSASPLARLGFLGLVTAISLMRPLQRIVSRQVLYGR